MGVEISIDVVGHGPAEAGPTQRRPGVRRNKVFLDVELCLKQHQSPRRVRGPGRMGSYVFIYILRQGAVDQMLFVSGN